jgi:hypothetical protein
MIPGTIMIDKERHFILTNRGRKAFKQLTGKSITDKDISPSDEDMLPKICWALLVGEDKTLTWEQAEEMLDVAPIPQLMRALTEAMKADTPLD